MIFRSLKIVMATAGCLLFASAAMATERYIPGIWVDPDGCEHWTMDDGVEGYMTPHVTRDGIPVCRRGNPCAVLNADQLFRVDRHYISTAGRSYLENFFRSANVTSFIIDGHTDSDASDAYNMSLSKRRAMAVANVARSVGAQAQTRWYGERVPVASNSTRAGKRKNRRVEITCVR